MRLTLGNRFFDRKKSCRIMGDMFAESNSGSRLFGPKKIGPCQIHFFGGFSMIVGNYNVLASRIGLFGSVRVFGWLANLVCGTRLFLSLIVVIPLVEISDFHVLKSSYLVVLVMFRYHSSRV